MHRVDAGLSGRSVEAHAGGIDHHQLAEPGGNSRQQPVRHIGFSPADEPVVDGPWRSGIPPRRTETETPEDTVQHPPVIDPGHSTQPVRQQPLDDQPFLSVSSYYRRAIVPAFPKAA